VPKKRKIEHWLPFLYPKEEENEYPYLFPLSHPFRYLINGRSGSGKTTLLLNLLLNPHFLFNRFDVIVIFSRTIFKDKLWLYLMDMEQKGLVRVIRVEGFNAKILQHFIKELKKDDTVGTALIILDDVVGESLRSGGVTQYQNYLDQLWTIIRHEEKFSIIASLQKLTAVSPVVRDNSDGISVNNTMSKPEMDTIVKEFGRELSHRRLDDMLNYIAEDDIHDWLFIKRQGVKDEFRKNFNEIIDIV
jgi:hypothetical protein